MSEVVCLPLPDATAADPLGTALACIEHGEGRVVLTRDGRPVAAVVPIADLRALEETGGEDAYWSGAAEAAVRQWDAEGRPAGIPMEEIARELGIDLAADM